VGCADADTIAAFVANALPDAARFEIVTHAASCERCHALLEGLIDQIAPRETERVGSHLASELASGRVAAFGMRAGSADGMSGRADGMSAAYAGHDTEVQAFAMPSLVRGMMVGEYRIESKLGEGGMGCVYGAIHPVIAKRAAIKILHPEFSAKPDIVERFIQEARSVNQIGHPNIVDIFSFGALPDGRPYLAMEYLNGESLRTRLRRRRLPMREVFDVVETISNALAAAHGAGIVHRDLKPDNIFLVEGTWGGARVKLLDFGVAKLLGDDKPIHTRTGNLLGTPAYMSPEQARGRAVDHRTDIYALGALFFEMLTGALPFPAKNTADMLSSHLHTPPPSPRTRNSTVPPELDRLVLAMMAKDPNARPTLSDVCGVIARLRGSGVMATIAASEAASGLAQQTPGVALGTPQPAGAATPHRAAAPYPGATPAATHPAAATPYPGATPHPAAATPHPAAATPYPGATPRSAGATPHPTAATPYPGATPRSAAATPAATPHPAAATPNAHRAAATSYPATDATPLVKSNARGWVYVVAIVGIVGIVGIIVAIVALAKSDDPQQASSSTTTPSPSTSVMPSPSPSTTSLPATSPSPSTASLPATSPSTASLPATSPSTASLPAIQPDAAIQSDTAIAAPPTDAAATTKKHTRPNKPHATPRPGSNEDDDAPMR
jgi:serine/threonine-protein kinase